MVSDRWRCEDSCPFTAPPQTLEGCPCSLPFHTYPLSNTISPSLPALVPTQGVGGLQAASWPGTQ